MRSPLYSVVKLSDETLATANDSLWRKGLSREGDREGASTDAFLVACTAKGERERGSSLCVVIVLRPPLSCRWLEKAAEYRALVLSEARASPELSHCGLTISHSQCISVGTAPFVSSSGGPCKASTRICFVYAKKKVIYTAGRTDPGR